MIIINYYYYIITIILHLGSTNELKHAIFGYLSLAYFNQHDNFQFLFLQILQKPQFYFSLCLNSEHIEHFMNLHVILMQRSHHLYVTLILAPVLK
jgi:hypothetical protein